jgi:hypothetical protein
LSAQSTIVWITACAAGVAQTLVSGTCFPLGKIVDEKITNSFGFAICNSRGELQAGLVISNSINAILCSSKFCKVALRPTAICAYIFGSTGSYIP